MLYHALCFVAICILTSRAQVSIPGVCQEVTVQQNFDIPAYLNLWYEQERYFTFFQINGKCVTATYTDNMNGTIGVNNFQINSETGAEDSILGYATPVGADGEGKLLVTFPSAGVEGDYWVLGTDYTSYTVVWSCDQATPDVTLQSAWILTREQFPMQETMDAAHAVAAANMLAPEFIITDQTNCP